MINVYLKNEQGTDISYYNQVKFKELTHANRLLNVQRQSQRSNLHNLVRRDLLRKDVIFEEEYFGKIL
jgi:hypothetical protein